MGAGFVHGVKISVENVSKIFSSSNGKKIEAVRNVSLQIREHEFLAIVGPSGCGKTTLLNIMAGLVKPEEGRVCINGNPLNRITNSAGYMIQADSLLPWRTLLGNVEIGLEIRGMSKKERRRIAGELIERVGLRGFEKSYPFELSGGMKKRAAFIRTLAYDPEIIFMDEPFGALDVQTRDMLEDDILRMWEETKKTIIFVTHDLVEAIALADRVILMTARPGTIKAEYPVSLPRPRTTTEIRFAPEFVEIHKQIWQDLSSEVLKVYKGGNHHEEEAASF